MPEIVPEFQLQQGHAIRSWPFEKTSEVVTSHAPASHIQPVRAELTSAEYGFDRTCAEFRRGDRVLHPDWGLGRILRTTEGASNVTVQWSSDVHSVSTHQLRRLLPRTILAEMIESTAPDITAWMVRKADANGSIRPDAIGRFAAHKVHYYDAARLPALIEELARHDQWITGTLVSHSDFGAGRIVNYVSTPLGISGIRSQYRLVHFFSSDAPARVPVSELRRLIASHVVARRIGVDRKMFARRAVRHGIEPDFICQDRGQRYYAEDRTEEIRRRCFAPVRTGALVPGSLVVDPCGDLATVDFVDDKAGAHLRSVQDSSSTQAPLTRIRELVSLRELARREKMSRYKLQRLLAAAQVGPVHRDGRTIYFDNSTAGQAIRRQLRREESALKLAVLSQRTGVSPEILAKKVRQGCIRTICRDGIHLVEEQEARRVQSIVVALKSESEGLPGLGVCRFQPRGRRGQELVHWDINRLVKAVQSVTADRQSTLFDQIAWVCEGAGLKRFQEAVDAYINSSQRTDESTRSLLTVLDHLPACSKMCQMRLMLLAYSCTPIQSRLQKPGKRGNGHNHHADWAFLERSIREVLIKCTDVFSPSEHICRAPEAAGYPEDEFVPGAVIMSVRDGKLHPGVIVRVEQTSWNTVARAWNKTIVIRFSDREWRANPQILYPENSHSGPLPLTCLLNAKQARSLFQAISRTIAQHAA